MKIQAVLLAAGSSRRFGADNKLLAPIGAIPLVVRVATMLSRCRVDRIVVVTGHDADRVRAALGHLPLVRFVHNPRHLDGIGRSISVAAGAVSQDIDGALVVQGDMPSLPAMLVDAVIARFEAMCGERVAYPALPDGRQCNPVLWPRRLFASLAALDGDAGGKSLIQAEGEAVEPVLWPDAAAFADIDTVGELPHLSGAGVLERRARA